MPRFMLALYDDPEHFTGLAPAEIQAIVEKYKQWRERVASSGHLVGGDKLQDGTGRLMRTRSGKVRVHDGPFSEAKEVLGGYFMIQAHDYDEAVELCRDHPHLAHGTLEVRQIDEV